MSNEHEKDTTGVDDGGRSPDVGRTAAAAPARPKRKSRAKASAGPASAKSPEKKAPARRAKRAKPKAEARSGRARDEASIPPTWSDLDAHGHPLAGAPLSALTDAPLEPGHAPSPGARPQALPIAGAPTGGGTARRGSARLAWYAKVAAGLAAVVCVAAFGRAYVGRARHVQPSPDHGVVAAVAAPVAGPALDPSEDQIVPPADTLKLESAEDDKRAALSALEVGKLQDAIVAGARSVEIDPTDADAWLILGAAYQDRGDVAGARRSYLACTKQATRGEVRECGFLLQ